MYYENALNNSGIWLTRGGLFFAEILEKVFSIESWKER